MISVMSAWNRLKVNPAYKGLKLSDFRTMVYTQQFPSVGSLATIQPQPQNFPGGGVILGVTASAVTHGVSLGQPGRSRAGFRISLAYSGGEQIAVSTSAEALLGSGENCSFPVKELVVPPTQTLLCGIQNLTTDTLDIDVCYHILTWRFAQ